MHNNHLRPQVVRAAQKTLRGCVFPVALLTFEVTTDKGFFGWLLAPKITADGPRLVETDTVTLEPAAKPRIEKALSEVRRWYEARPLRTNNRPVQVQERVRRKINLGE